MVLVNLSLFLALPSASGTDEGTANLPHQPASQFWGFRTGCTSPALDAIQKTPNLCTHYGQHAYRVSPASPPGARCPSATTEHSSDSLPWWDIKGPCQFPRCPTQVETPHNPKPLHPVAPLPCGQECVWLHRTLQVRTCVTLFHPVLTHEPDSPPQASMQAGMWVAPAS